MKKFLIGFVEGRLVPVLPDGIKYNAAIRYLYSRLLFKSLPHEGKTILLYTQTKSGTYYMFFLLANYLLVHFEGADQPVIIEDLERHFPNSPDNLRGHHLKPRPPHRLFASTQYWDMVVGHDDTGIEFSPAKIIALYRNPLDFIVSNYYYRYRNRKSVTAPPETADGIVEDWLPYLIKTYRLMDKLGSRSNAIRFAYEDLVRYPEAVLASVIRWLDLPLDNDHLSMAVAFSSFDVLHSYEEKHGPMGHEGSDFTGKFFTRSGKIGEWKDELKPETVSYIRDQLEANGINFSRFVTE